MPQAVEACHALHEAGYELVCVSALQGRYAQARERNLRALGFPIDRIVATGSMREGRSPKADAVAALRPVAFVDDYLPYFTGVEGDVHKALVMRGKTGSPNQGEGLDMIHSRHADLADFAAWWLNESGKHSV